MVNYNNMSNNLNEQDEKTGTKDFLLGALIGGVIGAATALWLSPNSRTALREKVNNQTTNLKERAGSLQIKVSDLAQITKDKTNSLTTSISNQSSEILSKIKGIGSNQNEDDLLFNKDENKSVQNQKSSVVLDIDPIQKMLEDTKKAFDETETKLNH